MNETQKGLLDEVRANVRSLAQLASWQLALAHEVEARLSDLAALSAGRPRQDAAKGRAAGRSGRAKAGSAGANPGA